MNKNTRNMLSTVTKLQTEYCIQYIMHNATRVLLPVLIQTIFETVHWCGIDNVSWQSVPVINNRLAKVVVSNPTANFWELSKQDLLQELRTCCRPTDSVEGLKVKICAYTRVTNHPRISCIFIYLSHVVANVFPECRVRCFS